MFRYCLQVPLSIRFIVSKLVICKIRIYFYIIHGVSIRVNNTLSVLFLITQTEKVIKEDKLVKLTIMFYYN